MVSGGRLVDPEVEAPRPKKGCWNNWVILSLIATVCFCSCNLMIGELSGLGLPMLYYYNSGSLVFTVGYFIQRKCRANPLKDLDRKPFLYKESGAFNYQTVCWLFYCAIVQCMIIMAVSLTFSASVKSGLNPGIASCIWSVTPFISAIVDRILFHVSLVCSSYVGMICMVLCGVAVSLSGLMPGAKAEVVDKDWVATLPIYVAVLCAIVMPICVVMQQAAQKYVVFQLKINSDDFTYGYFLLMSAVLQIMSIIKFSVAGNFVIRLWIFGSIGSILNCFGCLFAVASFATGAPSGPIVALQSSQIVLLVVIEAVRQLQVPQYMQLIGLFFGILGTLILSAPDEMYTCLLMITCRKRQP